MGNDSNISAAIKWARSQGWKVEPDSKGYQRFYDPQGNFVTSYPATPSSQRRWKNFLADVQRAGLPWPPPSKKEQRAARRAEESAAQQEEAADEDDGSDEVSTVEELAAE